jgi:predicted MPP superfamily phosphohydrolase
MKSLKINRRKFLLAALLATPAVLGGDGRFLEPTWLETRSVRINGGRTGVRFAQFSDVHHKGNRAYLNTVVDKINALAPDFTCFTGDLIEEKQFLPETLEILSGIESPLYGVPGNHDYWSGASFAPIRKCFAATGGAWLMNQDYTAAGGKINLIGSASIYPSLIPPPRAAGGMNILLMHYPAWAKQLGDRKYDLILAGHSHGGQVRIPYYGAPFLPYFVDQYERGLFQSPAGPLYVNAGIGYIGSYNFRLNCRPEITIFEV